LAIDTEVIKKEIKKVLLVAPPVYSSGDREDINLYPPLGLAYLAASLERIGIEIEILDCFLEGRTQKRESEIYEGADIVGLNEFQIGERIKDFQPDMVGVSNIFSRQAKLAHCVYSIVKRIDSSIVTVAGGAHPSASTEIVLRDDNIDFVVSGEGEQALVDLIEKLKDGLEPKIGIRKRHISNVDEIPFPAWDIVGLSRYFGSKTSHGRRKYKKFVPVLTSRGCPVGCTFCSAHRVWGKKYRARSPENVVEELSLLVRNFGVEEIMFEDDNLTLNSNRALKLFDLMVKVGLDLSWDTPNGVAVWTLSEQLIDKMKASGCYKLNFALESGSQRVLDEVIKKPVKLNRAKELVRYVKSIGLDVGLFLVVGMPGETLEEMEMSFALAEELSIYFPHVSIATPYPGSRLFNNTLIEEFRKNPEDYYKALHTRSYLLNGEQWIKKDLRQIVQEGEKNLLVSAIKNQPLQVISKTVKSFFANPVRTMRRIQNLF